MNLNIAAIISEYNPFHNGHEYQIKKIRQNNISHIISIMGGNFTQRGLPSIISKHKKAEMALKNGCDLIIELLTPYSVSSAETFSYNAVYLINSLNCVNFLSFGCENDNLNLLKYAAKISNANGVITLTKQYLKRGISFATARELAIKHLYTEKISKLFHHPNNILAIEYIKSLNKLRSSIDVLPILRKNSQNIISSSKIREMIMKNDLNYKNFVPRLTYEILTKSLTEKSFPASLNNCESALLARLRCLSKDYFINIADVNEGLENKIYDSIQKSNSLSELYSNIKSKRYTRARIQRIILSAFLDIDKNILKCTPPFIKILGFNNKGLDILKIIKKRSNLPIITKYSEIKKILNNNKNANIINKFMKIEQRAYDLYNLMTPQIQKCGFEFSMPVVKI